MLLFRGGYLGVDIFLVVSGFLICTSILNSQAIPNHQFSLIHFYKRRFYRLSLPLIPLILFCAVLGYFVLAPNIFHELLSETARALTFLSNQYFAKQGGYFALNSLDKILLHTWYLSLIGQFYIVFPLVVILINKQLGQRYLKAAIFALTIFTFVYAEQKFILTKADNLYYLSTMRAWELLFGASLAFIKIEFKNKKLCFYLGVAALVGLIIYKTNQTYNPFSILYVALATAFVIIANYQDSSLNNRVVQFVGKSSYSLYLWHWSIMVFCSRLMIFEATWFVVTLIIITWLLSYRFEKLDKKYFWVAATIYCLIGASTFGVQELNEKGYVELNVKAHIKKLDTVWDSRNNGNSKILESIKDKSAKVDTLLLGDSNASHYLDYFRQNLNFKYVELHGSLNYGSNLSAVFYNRMAYFSPLLHNINIALSQMADGSRVILANRWNHYEQLASGKAGKLVLSSQYKGDMYGALLADFDAMVSNFSKVKVLYSISTCRTYCYRTFYDGGFVLFRQE